MAMAHGSHSPGEWMRRAPTSGTQVEGETRPLSTPDLPCPPPQPAGNLLGGPEGIMSFKTKETWTLLFMILGGDWWDADIIGLSRKGDEGCDSGHI